MSQRPTEAQPPIETFRQAASEEKEPAAIHSPQEPPPWLLSIDLLVFVSGLLTISTRFLFKSALLEIIGVTLLLPISPFVRATLRGIIHNFKPDSLLLHASQTWSGVLCTIGLLCWLLTHILDHHRGDHLAGDWSFAWLLLLVLLWPLARWWRPKT